MMTQAILILCGHEVERLPLLVNQFDNRFRIYIHIDKKITFPATILEKIISNSIVNFVSQSYVTNWGSMNLVNAILLLCRKAVEDSSNTHFHLISGSDFPIATNDKICEMFQSPKDSYIEYFKLPTRRWNDGGLSRLIYYHPLDSMDFNKPDDRSKYELFLEAQKSIGIRRELLHIPYYGGSTWWSLSRACVEYIVQKNETASEIYASMQSTFIPDEMFIQTILLNSPFASQLVNDNLRFILWKYKNGHIPANLDMDDLPHILKSGCIFMRKTDSIYSTKLIEEMGKIRNK